MMVLFYFAFVTITQLVYGCDLWTTPTCSCGNTVAETAPGTSGGVEPLLTTRSVQSPQTGSISVSSTNVAPSSPLDPCAILPRMARPNVPYGNTTFPTTYGGPFVGDMTYFLPSLGACGVMSADNDLVVAVSRRIFDVAGLTANSNPLCGLRLRASWGTTSLNLSVVDRCEGCLATDLDLTPGAFSQFVSPAEGRKSGMQWTWLEGMNVAAIGCAHVQST